MGSIVFLHGVGGCTPGWDEALADSLHAAGVNSHYDLWELDFDDLVSRAGVIRRRATPVAAGIDELAHAVQAEPGYRARMRALRKDVWPSPDRVEPPRRVPPPVLPGEVMVRLPMLSMRQAGHYRHNENVQSAVLERVSSVIADMPGPVIVIAHSLGSVVALDALHLYEVDVDLLVSVGSPLGTKDFWGASWQQPNRFPYDRIGAWLNVVNVRDPVPWARGVSPRFRQALDVYISAGKGLMGERNFHDAATYTGSDVLGRAVAAALMGQFSVHG